MAGLSMVVHGRAGVGAGVHHLSRRAVAGFGLKSAGSKRSLFIQPNGWPDIIFEEREQSDGYDDRAKYCEAKL